MIDYNNISSFMQIKVMKIWAKLPLTKQYQMIMIDLKSSLSHQLYN